MTAVTGLVTLLAVVGASVIPVVQDGKPAAAILLRRDAPQVGPERTAAAELVQYIERMSGARLQVREGDVRAVDERGSSQPLIALYLKPGTPHPCLDGYWIHTRGKCIIIQATHPRGILYGAYHLLRYFGCRWYCPGEVGEVVPKRATLEVPAGLDIRREPDFRYRLAAGLGPVTAARLGYNYVGLSNRPDYVRAVQERGLVMWRWGHMWPTLVTTQFYADGRKPTPMDFTGREDWLPMDRNGKRRMNKRTLCFSNPEALEWFTQNAANAVVSQCRGAEYVSIWPADRAYIDLCKCPRCQAAGLTMTDWYLLTFQGIKKKLDAMGWTGRIGWIVYHGTREPPSGKVALPENTRNMDMLYAPRERGGTWRGPFTSNDPVTAQYRKRLEGWLKYLADQNFQGTKTVFEYYYDLVLLAMPAAGRSFVVPKLGVMQEDIAFYADHGFDGFYDCCPPASVWWPDPLSKWIYAELLWDVDLDLGAAERDFYEHYYGPAGRIMQYVRRQAERWLYGDATEEAVQRIAALERDVDRAMQLAGDDETLKTRLRAAKLWVHYAALAKRSEVLAAQKKWQQAIDVEMQIRQFLNENADFLATPGIFNSKSNVRFLSEYVVNRHLRVYRPRAGK